MAYERTTETKVRGDSLDVFVSNLSKTFNSQVNIRNAEDETEFNRMVLEDNIDLDTQLDYRKEQLDRVSDDPTEKKRVRLEISGLKQRIEQKTFSDEYLGNLSDYEAGLSSVDSVISYLNDYRSKTDNQAILDQINSELVKKQNEKFSLTKQLLESQTSYALKDKSESVIGTQISRVQSAKTKALLAGDEVTSSMYDLQLQSLQKAQTENSIDKDVKNFAVTSITGFATATKLLDSYNSKIANSSPTGSIKIGDVTYASAQEFWTYKRDSYVADQSSSGFISRLSDEVSTAVKVSASKNTLTTDGLRDLTAVYNTVGTRAELSGYTDRLNAMKQDALQTGANFIADKVSNNYAVNYDISKATATLNQLKTLGVNVDSAFTKIITAGAGIKQNQVEGILAAAQQAMQNDPNLSAEDALNVAVSSGAGAVITPETLATTPESKIAGDAAMSAAAGAYKDNPLTTIAPPVTPAPTSAQTPTSAPTSSQTITIKAGDTLSAIAARHGTTVQELTALNALADPNKIQAGATLKLPGAPTPTTTPTPAPTQAPIAPTPVPTVQPVVPPVAPAAPAVPSNYTIKYGDTLGAIASRNSTTIEALSKLNNIVDPNKITAGTTLKLK